VGGVRGATWRLIDVLSDARYDRDGDKMAASELYVDLEPWSYRLFQLSSLCQEMMFGQGVPIEEENT
jgi:hypothetical protein